MKPESSLQYSQAPATCPYRLSNLISKFKLSVLQTGAGILSRKFERLNLWRIMKKQRAPGQMILLKRKQSLCYRQKIKKMEKTPQETFIQHHNTSTASEATVENKSLRKKIIM